MNQGAARGKWARLVTWAAVLLAVGSVLAALVAAVGSGQDWWHFRVGFTVLRYAFWAAAAGGVLALAGLGLAVLARRRKLIGANLIAAIVALGFLLYLGSQIRTARSAPAIHDISTDLDDLPQFTRLKVREDNLENVPDMERAELKAMDPEARWKAIHREAYGDIRMVRLDVPPEEAVRRAAELARERGWEVAHMDAKAGTLEATDTTFFFRFKDDVAVRVRPAPGGGSLVDMRSISRVGGSDVGVNAQRIRAFLADLQAEG